MEFEIEKFDYEWRIWRKNGEWLANRVFKSAQAALAYLLEMAGPEFEVKIVNRDRKYSEWVAEAA